MYHIWDARDLFFQFDICKNIKGLIRWMKKIFLKAVEIISLLFELYLLNISACSKSHSFIEDLIFSWILHSFPKSIFCVFSIALNVSLQSFEFISLSIWLSLSRQRVFLKKSNVKILYSENPLDRHFGSYIFQNIDDKWILAKQRTKIYW